MKSIYDEFYEYSEITKLLFAYMNGRINIIVNNCDLSIGYYGINNIYGGIRYPNHITIYVGTILESWRDEWNTVVSKRDYVCTLISLAVSHELFHADQLISMLRYSDDIKYRNKVEGDVERACYNYVAKNAKILESIAAFKVVLDSLEFSNLPKVTHYKKASVKEFYLQTIKNIVFRNPHLYSKFKIFEDDKIADDIIIVFNNSEQVAIKRNGVYLSENITLFSNIAYRYAGCYDCYKVYGDCTLYQYPNNAIIATLNIYIRDALIKPVYEV